MIDSLRPVPPLPSTAVADRLAVSPDLPHVTPSHRRTRVTVLRAVRRLTAWLFRRYYRVQVHGFENVPRTGPVILAANHLAVLDGPLVVAMTRRVTFAMAKNELFSGTVGNLLEVIGQIPVDQYHVDTHALDRAVKVIREGHAFAIFPEGGRDDGEMREIKGGAAYLAMVTGAPIVPVAILGSREPGQTIRELPRRGGTIHLAYGAPIAFGQVTWPRTRDRVRAATEELRHHCIAHLADAQAAYGMPLPGKPSPVEEPAGLAA